MEGANHALLEVVEVAAAAVAGEIVDEEIVDEEIVEEEIVDKIIVVVPFILKTVAMNVENEATTLVTVHVTAAEVEEEESEKGLYITLKI
jgi:hypothetical protein